MVVKLPPVSTKPCCPVASRNHPTIWPRSLIPMAWVTGSAPGTSTVVKLPPVYKKPCVTGGAEPSHDLAVVVDPGGCDPGTTRILGDIDGDEAAARIHKASAPVASTKRPTI